MKYESDSAATFVIRLEDALQELNVKEKEKERKMLHLLAYKRNTEITSNSVGWNQKQYLKTSEPRFGHYLCWFRLSK